MKRLLASLTFFAMLAATPASAAIALISGTGTGGTIGGISFSSTASLGVVMTATIPANSLVVVSVANCATGTVTSFSVSDTHSNTYTAPRAIDQANGAAEQIFYSYTGATINSGDTITVGLSGPTGCLTGQVLAFSGADPTPYDVSAGTSYANASGTITFGPTGTVACPGGAAGCEVFVGNAVLHIARTTTNDANFVNTTTTGAGQTWLGGYWIVGATTAHSYAPSFSGGTSNAAGQIFAFKAAVAAGTNKTCTIAAAGGGTC